VSWSAQRPRWREDGRERRIRGISMAGIPPKGYAAHFLRTAGMLTVA
jgi:hypothetical protein